MTRLRRKGVIQGSVVAVLVVLAILVPVFAADPASTNIAVFIAMYVGLATAWNIMGGYTGYISLGHAAFFGFGAYALGLVLAHLGIQGGYEPFVFVPVAGALTALLAVAMGWVALRTRAATFVIVTIAMMFMIQLLAENLDGLTGGGAGLGFPTPPWSGDFYNDPFYYAMLLLALIAIAVSWWIRRSKFGLGLLAIRDDEDKALAVGVPAHTYKLIAFIVSAALVGMIGAVYGYYVTYIYPQFAIDPLIGLSMVLMAFLGGLGTLWGPVLGAVILEYLQLTLAYNLGASELYLVFYAAAFLVAIRLMPRGIIPSVVDLAGRFGRRRAAGPNDAAANADDTHAVAGAQSP
jgi:branched-chain amino acid transport system permease protein